MGALTGVGVELIFLHLNYLKHTIVLASMKHDRSVGGMFGGLVLLLLQELPPTVFPGALGILFSWIPFMRQLFLQ